MAEPEHFVLPMLREMRAEISGRFDGVDGRLDRVERRLKKLEEAQVSYRQALTADTLISRLLTGEFEERIEQLERKVEQLESQK
jgi:hypothetical protein